MRMLRKMIRRLQTHTCFGSTSSTNAGAHTRTSACACDCTHSNAVHHACSATAAKSRGIDGLRSACQSLLWNATIVPRNDSRISKILDQRTTDGGYCQCAYRSKWLSDCGAIVIAVLVHRAMAKRALLPFRRLASVAAASPRAVAIASAFAIAGAQVLGCSGNMLCLAFLHL